jgi:hypothetical protein
MRCELWLQEHSLNGSGVGLGRCFGVRNKLVPRPALAADALMCLALIAWASKFDLERHLCISSK